MPATFVPNRPLSPDERQRIAERCAALDRSNGVRELATCIDEMAYRPRSFCRRCVLDLFQAGRHAGGMVLRAEIVSAISFVLRLRIGQRLKRTLGMREETDARVLAEQIVAHLERCRFRFSQEPPPAAHSTPDTSSSGSDAPPER